MDITAGPDGNVWFSEGAVGQIAFITPSGRIKEILFSSSGAAAGIVTGSDGNIWFTDLIGNSIWRLELSTQRLDQLPCANAEIYSRAILLWGRMGIFGSWKVSASRLAGSLRRVSLQNLAPT